MKKALVLMAVLLATMAFAGGAMAQAPATAEKPAPAVEKPKAEKAEAVRFSGAVIAYQPKKMIKVKRADNKEMTFSVTAKTQVKGEVKEGAMVSVAYKQEGDKMVATGIALAKPKTPPKKASEKAAEKAPPAK
ncbi:MAG: hypothetical protein HXY45_03015 [Syntrophaceae bacterium]|nr:hypothetical protein [Syntrophaceae bacterium]